MTEPIRVCDDDDADAAALLLPVRYPASMLLYAIDDDATQQVLRDEAALRAQRARLLDELQQLQAQRDAQTCAAAAASATTTTTTTTTTATSSATHDATTLEQLQQQKAALHRELEDAYRAREAVVQAQHDVRAASSDVVSLSRDVNACTLLLHDEERTLARQSTNAASTRGSHHKNNSNHNHNNNNGNNSNNNKSNGKATSDAAGRRRASTTTTTAATVSDKTAAATVDKEQPQQRVSKYATQLREKTAQLHAAQATLQQCRATLQRSLAGGTLDALHARVQTLRARLAGLQQQHDALARARATAAAHAAHERDAWRQQQQRLREAVHATESRLRDVRARRLPCTHFTYAVERRARLLGPAGATLRQLQIDYGVALCLDGVPPGHGVVVGAADARAACVRAMVAVLASHDDAHATTPATAHVDALAASASPPTTTTTTTTAVSSADGDDGSGSDECTATLSYDVRDRRAILGERACNVVAIERATRARVRVDDDGVVRVRARTRAAVAAAVQLLRVLLDAYTRATLRFAPPLYPLVVGRDGAMVQRIERESGARHVHVDRAAGRIECSGSAAAVQRAVRLYTDLLADTAQCACEHVACDAATLRLLLERGGARVRAIARATDAHVSCSDTRVTIVGSAAAVRAAREHVTALQRRVEARVAMDARALAFVTAPLVAVTTRTNSKVDKASDDNDDDNDNDNNDVNKNDSNDDSNDDDDDEDDGRPATAAMTMLQAVRRVTLCDVVTPLYVEAAVLLRGALQSVRAAETMLQQLLRVNAFHALRVPCPLVLLRCLALRKSRLLAPLWSRNDVDEDDDDDDDKVNSKKLDDNTDTNKRSSNNDNDDDNSRATADASSRVPVWSHMDADEAASAVRVSAADAHDATAAATRLRHRIASLCASHVRRVTGIPAAQLGTLVAWRGARMRELQTRTHTYWTIVRHHNSSNNDNSNNNNNNNNNKNNNSDADAEVQVCSVDGDAQALRAGVRAVCEAVGVPVPVDDA